MATSPPSLSRGSTEAGAVDTDLLPGGPLAARRLVGELRAAREPWRLLAAVPRLLRAPRGDGGVVVDLPGWRAGERSMAPVRAYLRYLGHDAVPWGLGRNEGDVERDRDRLVPRVEELVAASGRPVALVGWSLGGVVAREVARARPELVRAVVHYGTPVIGGPSHTASARFWSTAARERIAAEQARVDADDPLRVPVTTIYSRQDRIVDWRASLDHTSQDVAHVEVGSTHFGLGLDPDVALAVAEALSG